MERKPDDALYIDVGARLRQLRQERNKSMRAIARESGLSTNALSMIERGLTSPSVSTLHKISGALGVPITAFFRLEPQKQEIVFRKADEHKKISLPHGVWEGLGGESFVGRMEPFLLTLATGACSGPTGMLHSGYEFALCLEGKIEFNIQGNVYLLNPGDSLIFSAQLNHRWCSVGEGKARAIIVLAGFEQGEQPSEFHISAGMKSLTLTGDEFDADEVVDFNAEAEEV